MLASPPDGTRCHRRIRLLARSFVNRSAASRAASPEGLLEPVAQGAQDLDPGPALVLGLDQGPGRVGRAGPVDHVVDRRLVLAPPLAVAPVLRRDLEPLQLRPLALLEAPELLVLADGEPELDHDDAGAVELLLEVVDLAVGPQPLSRAGEALHPLDQDPAVPGAVEDRDVALARHVAPEAPEVGAGLLLVGGRSDGVDPEAPRVERRRRAADAAALAGRVVALEDGDHGPAPEGLAVGEPRQAVLLGREPGLVLRRLQGVRHVERGEHRPAV